MSKFTLSRPRIMPVGPMQWIDIELCSCPAGKRRGPEGGVCGACAGAIPTEAEYRAIEQKHRLSFDRFCYNPPINKP